MKKNTPFNSSFISQKISLNLLVIVMTLALILIGGLTRLTGSGLSMVDWAPIKGVIPPITSLEWQQEFNNYQKYPEFKEKNFWMSLSDFKRIFYFEYIHRMLGRLIGLSLFAIFLYFLLKKKLTFKEKANYISLLILVSLQGVLGWYMVKSGLVDNPFVSHYRLAAHLSLALVFLIYLWLFWLSHFNLKKNQLVGNANKVLNGLIVLTFIQIVLGAFNSGLDAGLIASDYPKMRNEWLPREVFFNPSSTFLLDNPFFIHFFHRHLGILLGAALIFFSFYYFSKAKTPDLRYALLFLGIFSISQPLLGILITLKSIPISLASLHQMIAVFMMLNLFYLKWRVRS